MTAEPLKAELISFWCARAAEGRGRSAASAKIGPRQIFHAFRQWLRYALGRGRRAGIMIVAHPDRGAGNLADIPYVGALAARLGQKRTVLLLQMQPLRPVDGVISYPWLMMRIFERLSSRLRRRLAPEDEQLASRLAARYSLDRGLVAARLSRLNFETAMWDRLLDTFRPAKVLLVDGYSSNAALIFAARRRGITTIEVQHGSCVRSHKGYRRIAGCEASLFPDYFLAWSQFWADEIGAIPGYGAKVKVCPAAAQRLRRRDLESDPLGGILLIHQPTASRFLFDILETLPDGPGKSSSVAVKYHPGIQPEWRARLDRLCERKGVVIHDKDPIEDLIGRHGAIAGWFSTVLYQARDAGCETYYFPIADFEEQQKPLARQGIEPMEREAFLSMAARHGAGTAPR